MNFKSLISAVLVGIVSLACMICTQDVDIYIVYAAFCSSPYVFIMVLVYFNFSFFRKKFKQFDKPNPYFELFYSFFFYLAGCILFPLLLFLGTLGDPHEHKLYENITGMLSEMMSKFLFLSAFLAVFSTATYCWAMQTYGRLLAVLLGYFLFVPFIYSIAQTRMYIQRSQAEKEVIAYNIKENRYKWYASMSNPTAYPVQLYKGSFVFPNNDKYDFSFSEGNDVNYKANWGAEGGRTYADVQALPKGLAVTWYAFAEDAFYQLDTPIDYDKLLTLFQEPFLERRYNADVAVNYDCIVLGFAPGGMLQIWASSAGRRQVEIGRYQAVKVKAEKPLSQTETIAYGDVFNAQWREHVLRDSMIIPLKVQEAAKKEAIPFGYWDRLSIRYNWKPSFEIPAEIKLHTADFSFFNSERFVFFDKSLYDTDLEMRALPKNAYLKWYNAQGHRCAVDFDFEEEQTFVAFEKFFKGHTQAALHIEIDYKTQKASASLQDGEDKLLLLETTIINYGKNY